MTKYINGVREPVLNYFYTYPEKFGPLLMTTPFNKRFRQKQLKKIQDNFIILYDWICDGNVWDYQNEFSIIINQYDKTQSKKYLTYLQSSKKQLTYLLTQNSSHKFEFQLTKEQMFYAIRLLNKKQLQILCRMYIKDNYHMVELKRVYNELYGKYKLKK